MKRRNKQYTGKRGGFGIKAMFLAIGALGILAVILYSVFGGASRSEEAMNNSKQYAVVPLSQGSALVEGFSRKINNGDTELAAITADDQNFATDEASIYHPVKGTANVQVVPVDVFASSSTVADRHWFFNKKIKIKNVGSASTESFAFVLPDIAVGTCTQINVSLYKDDVNSAPPSSAASLANWKTGAVDDSSTSAMSARQSGCSKTSDGKYVFYTMAIIN